MLENSDEAALLQPPKTYKSFTKLVMVILNINISFIFFGYCQVYLGSIPIKTLIDIYNITIQQSVAQGLLNGCIPIGAVVGALTSGFFIKRFSRRNCFLIMNVVSLIVGLCIFIPTFPTLLFFRICQGFCVGFYAGIAPLVVKQTSPKEIAGTLGSLIQICLCLGVTLGLFLTYILRKIYDDESCKSFWFIVFAFPSALIMLQTMTLLFVFPYETPKYFITQGQEDQAKKLIKVFYKPECVEMILQQKKNDFTDNTSVKTSTSVQTDIKDHHLAIVVAIHVAFLGQFSGVNAIAVYGQQIAAQIATGELKLLIPTLVNCLQLVGSVIVCYLLSKIGRRILLILGPFLTGVSCGLVTIGFLIKDSTYKDQGQTMVLVGLLLFMFFYGVALGPICCMYIAQIVQPRIMPYAIATNWASASLIVIFFPILTDKLQNGNPGVLFIFFTAWSIAASIFGYFTVVETKDKTQKQIREDYGRVLICK